MREIKPGVWQLRVSLGKDPRTGKYRQSSTTFLGGKQKAQRALEQFAASVPSAQVQAEQEELAAAAARETRTVKQLLDTWLKHKQRQGKATRTVIGYVQHVRTLSELIGDIALKELDLDKVEKCYAELENRGLTGLTIQHYHRTLSNAARWGQARGWLDRDPTFGATKAKVAKQVIIVPSPDEVRNLLEVAPTICEEFGVFIALAVDTWARPGEVTAMRWDRIIEERGEVIIDAAMDITGETKDTKTHSNRRLALSAGTLDVLERYRSWRIAQGRGAEGFLFDEDGFGAKPWHPHKSTQLFRRAKAKAGGKFRLYDLRHFGATQAILSGMPISMVSYRLGHKKISTTLDHYAHFIPHMDRDLADFMGELMAPPPAIEA